MKRESINRVRRVVSIGARPFDGVQSVSSSLGFGLDTIYPLLYELGFEVSIALYSRSLVPDRVLLASAANLGKKAVNILTWIFLYQNENTPHLFKLWFCD